jgi:hypothetical protein
LPRKLILFSKTPEDLIFASQVAIISGMEIHPVMDHRVCVNLIQELSEKDIGGVFLDASDEKVFKQFENFLQEEIGLFSEKINTNRFHFISDKDIDLAPYLSKSPLFGNFILRNYKSSDDALEAGKRYGYYARVTTSSRSFGMKNYFSPNVQIQAIQMKRSTQKLQVVEAIRGYLIKAKFPSRVANKIANAVDEIVMNSVFTAPIDDLGNRPMNLTSRDTDFELDEKSQVEVTVAFDHGLVGVSSADLFGSLDKSKLVQHLSDVFAEEDYKIRNNTASAGLGLNNTFKTGGSLIFVCEKGLRTEVGVIFARTDNYREFKKQFRFLSTQFYYPSEDVGI